MSFLEQLKSRKAVLKHTKTVVTRADGKMYVEDGDLNEDVGDIKQFGFVVDNSPDNVPAEIVRGLFIGSQDCAEESIVEKYQITHVLSVGICADVSNNVRKLFVSCLDLPETNILPVLSETNVFIEDAISNGGNVLVHCNAGVSRAATVTLGYLIMEKKYAFEDAYELVKSKRPCIQPNAGFVKQLKALNVYK